METICMLLQKKKQFILFPTTAVFSSWLWTWVYFPPAKSVVLERKCMHTFSNKNNPNMVLNFFHIYWILIQQTSILLDASFSTHRNLYLFVRKIMWSFPLQNQRYQCKKSAEHVKANRARVWLHLTRGINNTIQAYNLQ